jgi:hypothetical protein
MLVRVMGALGQYWGDVRMMERTGQDWGVVRKTTLPPATKGKKGGRTFHAMDTP